MPRPSKDTVGYLLGGVLATLVAGGTGATLVQSDDTRLALVEEANARQDQKLDKISEAISQIGDVLEAIADKEIARSAAAELRRQLCRSGQLSGAICWDSLLPPAIPSTTEGT